MDELRATAARWPAELGAGGLDGAGPGLVMGALARVEGQEAADRRAGRAAGSAASAGWRLWHLGEWQAGRRRMGCWR